jgi:hypothetical protein
VESHPSLTSSGYQHVMREKYVAHEAEDSTFAILDAKTYEVAERSGISLEDMHWPWVESLIPFLGALDRHKERPN